LGRRKRGLVQGVEVDRGWGGRNQCLRRDGRDYILQLVEVHEVHRNLAVQFI
jgi:hypothetical protein